MRNNPFDSIVKNARQKRILKRVLSILCVVVLLFTMHTLKRDANTLERIPMCGLAEHTHTPDCYEGDALVCGRSEHMHTDACYQESPSNDELELEVGASVVDLANTDIDADLSLDENDFSLVMEDVAPALAANAVDEGPKSFVLGGETTVSRIIQTLGLNMSLGDIAEVGIVDDGKTETDLIGIEKDGDDYRIWARKNFAQLQLALILDKEIVTVRLLNGEAAPVEDAAPAEISLAGDVAQTEDVPPTENTTPAEDVPQAEADELEIGEVPVEDDAIVGEVAPIVPEQTEVAIGDLEDAGLIIDDMVDGAVIPSGETQPEEKQTEVDGETADPTDETVEQINEAQPEEAGEETADQGDETVEGAAEPTDGAQPEEESGEETADPTDETVEGAAEPTDGAQGKEESGEETADQGGETVEGAAEPTDGAQSEEESGEETADQGDETVEGAAEPTDGAQPEEEAGKETADQGDETVEGAAEPTDGAQSEAEPDETKAEAGEEEADEVTGEDGLEDNGEQEASDEGAMGDEQAPEDEDAMGDEQAPEGEAAGDGEPAEDEAPADQAAYAATIDLSEVVEYPLSLNALLSQAVPVVDVEAVSEDEAAEADADEAPAWTIDYDQSLLTIEEAEGDYRVTPAQSFESTQITVDNGSRYVLTLVNCALPEAEEAEAAEAAQPEDERPVYAETIDLSEVVEYPLSLNALLSQAAPTDDDAAAETESADAEAEEPGEAPAWTIDYDQSLLTIEEAEGDYLITPIASFESALVTVDNGSRYELTFVNYALPEVGETAGQPETAYPAQDFEGHTRYMKVVVSAPEGAFPEGTTMAVADVEDEKTLTDIEDTVSEEFVEVKRVHAVDITFTDAEGNEIEPLVPISVVMRVEEMAQQQEAVVVHVDDAGATEVVESRSEAPAGETEVKVEMPATDAPAPEAAEEKPADDAEESSVGFEADAFSVYAVVITETIETKYIDAEGATWNISVGYGPEAEIPAGATLAVEEVEGDYLEQTAELLKGKETITLARFFDITILDAEGNPVQPARPVEVVATLAEQSEDAVKAVHFAEAGPEIIEASQDAEAVSFDAASFSVYGIVYTVDFHYTVNGQTFDYGIPGGDCASLRELLPALNIAADDPETDENELESFMAAIADVTFSSPELVRVCPVEAETTVGALREAQGIESEYSAALTDEDRAAIDARALAAPDWALFSLAPFNTDETLTVAMENGDSFAVAVTDAQIATRVLAADGNTYNITLTFGPEAGIPLDAELKAEEILESEKPGLYTWYMMKAQKALETDLLNPISAARFFDIEILSNGEKIEPTAEVIVDIKLDQTSQDAETEFAVLHYVENSPVVMEIEIENTESVRFETDSFSVYGIVTYAGGTPAAYDLDGRVFAIKRSGTDRYATNTNKWEEPRKIGKGNANAAAQWLFESAGQPGQYYISTTGEQGDKVYLHMESAGKNNAANTLVYADGTGQYMRPKMPFTVGKNNNDYCIYFTDTVGDKYYLNEWADQGGSGFAGYNGNSYGNLLNFEAKDPVIEDNKQYMVILQKGDNYYEVLNDGTLERVERRVIDGVEKFVVSQPMMWKLEKDSNEDKYYINHQAFVKKTDNLSLPSEWYYRYITPSGNTGDTVGLNTDTVMPVVKSGESTTYPEWENNRQLKIDSAVRIDRSNNVVQSFLDYSYLGVNEAGTGMTKVWNQNDAAKVYFASADQFQVQLDQLYLRPYNLVNHIDIEVDAKARLTVPLGNGKVYDAKQHEVIIPGNRILNLEEHVDVTPQDLKNATITAYTKNNGVRKYIDDAFTITGYSGNAPIGITNTQVRVEGRFLVSTYYNGTDSDGIPIFSNEDYQSAEELKKRYNDRVFYDVSTKRKVTFYYTYTDPETNQKIELFDARGKRLSTETVVELTGSFDYWDPLNACPVLHAGWVPEGEFVKDWTDYKIPHDAWGGSGMDFTIGADEEGKYKKPGILITKYIYDEQNNMIELQDGATITSEFDIWERPIDGFAQPDASRRITNTVENVNRGGEHTKPDDDNTLYDTQEKNPPVAFDGFTNTHTVTVDVAQSGTGSKYDFSVESGMVYIREKNVQPSIIDKNGMIWNYVHTIIKTEYVKRKASDTQEEFHYTRVMTDTNKLNSVPEVVGNYYKDGNDDTDNPNSNDSLDFYVYNVYQPAKTSVVVQKAWEQNGESYSPEEGTTADIYLGRYKLTPKADYTSADNETKARVMIYQKNYNPKNAVWFENNRDLRPGDTLDITFGHQYHEVVRYSINGGSERQLSYYDDADKPSDWVYDTIEETIPPDGKLIIALDDEWSGVAGKITVKRGNDVIASIDDGDVPDSPYENPDMVYTIDKDANDKPLEFGPVRLPSANTWTGSVENLDPYDENGNQYRYFILREECNKEGTLLVVGKAENGEVLTSDGMEGDPTLTATNQVPSTTITIKKTDKNSQPLPGAVFRLSMNKNGSWVTIKDNITVAVPEEGTDATASVPNLFDGRYKLTEVQAPAGYIILNQEIYFNIQNGKLSLRKENGATADGEAYNNMVAVGDGTMFTVQNEPGVSLPATGGEGTDLYYVLGSLLTLAAVALLVVKRRMRA